MNKLNELMDFSSFDGNLPCILCKGDSSKTLMGNHWKCSACAHIFNQDGSDPKVMCICDICMAKAEAAAAEKAAEEPVDDKRVKRIEGALKKLKATVKKLSKKKTV